MALEVFHRYEKKYLLNEAQYQRISALLREHMVPDKYNVDGKKYTISNIYFDTREDYLIRRSLEKPEYKEKLRLRSYGPVTEEDKIFLEIKKKNLELVNKRRTVMTLKEAREYLLEGKWPENGSSNPQILREIDYLLSHERVEPKVYLAYDRIAWFSPEETGMRVTIDSGIRARRTDVRLDGEDYGKALLGEGIYLMEVKMIDSIPLWFTKALSEEKIYSTSFSKYGFEFQKYCEKLAEEKLLKTVYQIPFSTVYTGRMVQC